MSTNDPSAGKEEQREPLLSDDQLRGKEDIPERKKGPYTFLPSIWDVRDFYEAKITSGELRAVKTIPRDQFLKHVMNDCPVDYDLLSFMDTGFHTIVDFCPGCGAQIVK